MGRNLARETTLTSGAGNPYVLEGAVAEHRAISAVLADTETAVFCIRDGSTPVKFEIIDGYFDSGSNSVVPTNIRDSSNLGLAVNWPSRGSRDIYITACDEQLAGLMDPDADLGLMARSAQDTYVGRELQDGARGVVGWASDPDGIAGNPTLDDTNAADNRGDTFSGDVSIQHTGNPYLELESTTLASSAYRQLRLMAPAIALLAGTPILRKRRPSDGDYADSYLLHSGEPFQALEANLLDNPDFNLWSSGSSFTDPVGEQTADRWVADVKDGAGTISRQDFSVGDSSVSEELSYFLRFDQTGAPSADGPELWQALQGVRNGAGSAITIALWMKIDSPVLIDLVAQQYFGSGGSASSPVESSSSVLVTTSWQRYVARLSIPSISGKTIDGGDDELRIIVRGPVSTFTLDIGRAKAERGLFDTEFSAKSPSTLQRPPSIQVFTSNDTWSRPLGVKRALVLVMGAGGGGGSADGQGVSNSGAAAGGGAGGISLAVLDVATITSSTILIGTGGGGGTLGGNGSAGGNSSWADGTNTITANGGSGGGGVTAGTAFTYGTPGSGGTSSGGDVDGTGGSGLAPGSRDGGSSGPSMVGGDGSNSLFGRGGTGGAASGAAVAGASANGYGAGGGGGATDDTTDDGDGGAGVGGFILVIEFS